MRLIVLIPLLVNVIVLNQILYVYHSSTELSLWDIKMYLRVYYIWIENWWCLGTIRTKHKIFDLSGYLRYDMLWQLICDNTRWWLGWEFYAWGVTISSSLTVVFLPFVLLLSSWVLVQCIDVIRVWVPFASVC